MPRSKFQLIARWINSGHALNRTELTAALEAYELPFGRFSYHRRRNILMKREHPEVSDDKDA